MELHSSCSGDDVVTLILKKDHETGSTTLHWAAQLGRIEIMQVLLSSVLKNGGFLAVQTALQTKNRVGKTAKDVAQCVEMVQLFESIENEVSAAEQRLQQILMGDYAAAGDEDSGEQEDHDEKNEQEAETKQEQQGDDFVTDQSKTASMAGLKRRMQHHPHGYQGPLKKRAMRAASA